MISKKKLKKIFDHCRRYEEDLDYQDECDKAILDRELEGVAQIKSWRRLASRQVRREKYIVAQQKAESAFGNAVHDLSSEDYWEHYARTSVLAEVRQHLANQVQAARVAVRVSMLSDDLLPAAAERRVFSGSPVNTEVPGARLRTEPRRPGAPASPAA